MASGSPRQSKRAIGALAPPVQFIRLSNVSNYLTFSDEMLCIWILAKRQNAKCLGRYDFGW